MGERQEILEYLRTHKKLKQKRLIRFGSWLIENQNFLLTPIGKFQRYIVNRQRKKI